jgi:hypothetical protein
MSTSQRISNIELAVKQWSSGISNIGVAQDDLNYASDSVSVSGVDFIKNTFVSWSTNGVDVNQDDLNYASDSVLSIPERSFTISNFTPSGSDGLVIQANSDRKEFFIQNLIVAPLYVKYGSNATNTSFNYVLSGANFTHFRDSLYTGNVSVYSATTPSYISWERT